MSDKITSGEKVSDEIIPDAIISIEKLVTYCGLCYLDYHSFQQKIPDLARDLKTELRKSKYEKFADSLSTTSFGKSFRYYGKCYEVLDAMVKLRCNKGCKNWGPPFCKIRKCCEIKGIEGCWECDIYSRNVKN